VPVPAYPYFLLSDQQITVGARIYRHIAGRSGSRIYRLADQLEFDGAYFGG
jgi:hypothetical protein|tara:strand:- start:441 stop:593 length:153 start_codon:yes stop_codon:yes gene_type:complete